MSNMEFDLSQANKPSLPRRLGAFLYDIVLLLGVLMLANAVVVIPYEVITGHHIYEEALPLLLLRLYLLAVIGAFYVYFWTHGGQTLGMRAWRIRVVGDKGSNLGLGTAIVRFAWSIVSFVPAGLGLWWSLFDRDGLAWHDRKSHTQLVMLEKSA
ncbi:RDD domain containing protein [Thiorhodococcus drewsii AZ1]|uniref:RDD domain containing protein n=1 Tax=Thiorhodococcus drewsii AZ1 TaxID=765913 RepID=G2E5S9_9GAMM|nr:RDD domain containing protein [Thiorhodococcus drewsii AZ1]